MIELLAQLRAMQIFTHHAHNCVTGMCFFADHQFFGDAYAQMEADYDSLIERTIASGELTNLQSIMSAVVARIGDAPNAPQVLNDQYFRYLLIMELELVELIEKITGDESIALTEGQITLLGDIALASEKRQYLISQRLK